MAKEATHTPGPWAYQENADDYTHIVRTPGERFLCQLSQDASGTAKANARLIAAAPSMLAELHNTDDALTKLIRDLENIVIAKDVAILVAWQDSVRATISKATR